jgi:hypothetical protein
MEEDIFLLDSGNPIKNGTRVVSTGGLGSFSSMFKTLDSDVSNKPTIGEIENKYKDRLNQTRYYTGDTED